MTIYPWMISALSPTGCSAIKSEKPMTGFRFHMSFLQIRQGAYRHDRRGSRKRTIKLLTLGKKMIAKEIDLQVKEQMPNLQVNFCN